MTAVDTPATKLQFDSMEASDILAHVEEQLALDRTLGKIARDFVHSDGRTVQFNTLANRIRTARPGCLILYKPIGKLEIHTRVS